MGDRTLTDDDIGTDFLETLPYGRDEVWPQRRSARVEHTH